MPYTVNTNITSLYAQRYLEITQTFQSKTIQRVTSGLRIVSSADDAAGLAIANSIRSDRAVLTQGVRNINDGLATLQTIDGGLNNISQLLDRARTLAAQSASGTFTGDRSVLNQEFQSVLAEIDRQAQAIGLNLGGVFATTVSVFVGGGRAYGSTTAIENGTVSVDLSRATVDTRSLGLNAYEAAGADAVDLSAGQPTSVYNIVNDATNKASAADGYTDFYFYGPGFSGDKRIKVSVNVSNVTDLEGLVAQINAAIESAENGVSEAAGAFAKAHIRAVIKQDADGSQRLAFQSSNAAFQVRAGDRMANALLGNIDSGATGKALEYTLETSSAVSNGALAGLSAGDEVVVRFQGGGLGSPVDIRLTVGSGDDVAALVQKLYNAVNNNATLQAAGISMDSWSSSNKIKFQSATGEQFQVLVAGDLGNNLKLGSWRLSGTGGNYALGAFDYNDITSTSFTGLSSGDDASIQFVVGGQTISYQFDTTSAVTLADAVQQLNNFFISNSTARAAQLRAEDSGGELRIVSDNGTYFRVNVYGTDAANLGFGAAGDNSSAATSGGGGPIGYSTTVYAGGVSTVEASDNAALDFTPLAYASDRQTITVTVADSNGREKSMSIVLRADGTSVAGRSGMTLDQAIDYINRQLWTSNDADFQKIVAVKERIDNTHEGIRFISSHTSFRVSIGTTASGAGINDSGAQGVSLASETAAGGANVSIDSVANAQYAVTALALATSRLGSAQAAVGKGQNRFTFALSLAQTQLTNLAASESYIRDADLAAEAANLTKAQILQQAGVAALAQANVAPQAVLSLLRV